MDTRLKVILFNYYSRGFRSACILKDKCVIFSQTFDAVLSALLWYKYTVKKHVGSSS